MVSIREIADDRSSISSTRWAFASIIKVDIFLVVVAVAAYITAHFIGKPFHDGFFGGIATLIGVLTGIITTSKALQGFEPKKDKPSSVSEPEMVTEEIEKPKKSTKKNKKVEVEEVKLPEVQEVSLEDFGK